MSHLEVTTVKDDIVKLCTEPVFDLQRPTHHKNWKKDEKNWYLSHTHTPPHTDRHNSLSPFHLIQVKAKEDISAYLNRGCLGGGGGSPS